MAENQFKSASFEWLVAIFHDQRGEFELALTKINEAMNLDPCASGPLRSFEVICSRIRAALADLENDDFGVPELYRLLSVAGVAEVDDHLKMARFYAHRAMPDDALRLIEAVISLSPTHTEAWATKSLLLGAQGRVPESRAASVEASRLGFGYVPFAFSGLVRA